jgi:hypothetical protein
MGMKEKNPELTSNFRSRPRLVKNRGASWRRNPPESLNNRPAQNEHARQVHSESLSDWITCTVSVRFAEAALPAVT